MIDIDEALTAIGEPTRRRVVEVLADGPQRTSTLAKLVGVSVPALSRHLRTLRESRIVERVDVEGDGRGRQYRLDPAAVHALGSWLSGDRWANVLAEADHGPTAISARERRTYLRRVGGFLDGFATGDQRFFERHLADDALLYFPGSDQPWDKSSTVASVVGHAPYVQWDIDDVQLRRLAPTTMLVILTVAVRTTAASEPDRVVQSMIFDDLPNGRPWVLRYLQQTPV